MIDSPFCLLLTWRHHVEHVNKTCHGHQGVRASGQTLINKRLWQCKVSTSAWVLGCYLVFYYWLWFIAFKFNVNSTNNIEVWILIKSICIFKIISKNSEELDIFSEKNFGSRKSRNIHQPKFIRIRKSLRNSL